MKWRDIKMVNEFKTICKKCGEEYDNYTRNPCMVKDGVKTELCLDCIKELLKNEEYYYWNHVPMVVDGVDIVYKVFDTKDELLEGVKNEFNSEDKIFIDGHNIIKVYDNDDKGYLQGYVSCEIDLPKYEYK